MTKPKKTSPFKSLKNIKPRSFELSSANLVEEFFLEDEDTLPLVIQPKVQDLNHLNWLAEQRREIEGKLHRYGAILFRGFSVPQTADFEAFASCLAHKLFTDYGDLPPAEGKIYGVTPYPPEGTILFHSESSHLPRWPTKQFFYCSTPAAEGGETPIVDCRKIYRSLAPETQALFSSKKLRYVRNFIKGVDVSWQDFFKTSDPERVEKYCREHDIHFHWKNDHDLMTYQIRPAVTVHPVTGETIFFNQIQLHHVACLEPKLARAMRQMFAMEDLPRNVYWEDGSVLPEPMVKDLEKLYWKQAVAFKWRAGDILMVDNMLVAHARKPYRPPRKMFVAMGDMTDTAPSSAL